jgi:hypothetical protein
MKAKSWMKAKLGWIIDYDLANTFHECPKVISSLLESAPKLASSDNTSQYVFWFAIFVFAIQLQKQQFFVIDYPEFSSVVECAFSGGFTPSSNRKVLFALD